MAIDKFPIHAAATAPSGEVTIGGGKVATAEERHDDMMERHALDTRTLRWRICL
jgi:hypothetical protein